MASKRGLYKPAIQDGVAQKDKRKALPQGRLVTKPTAVTNVPRDAVDTTLLSAGTSTTFPSVPRRQLASAVVTSSTSSTVLPTENNSTPRKRLPHVSQDESPKQAKPSQLLDLSDTDDERDRAMGSSSTTDVLVVDASRPLKTLDDTEVDVALHFTQSPAKVICHAAGKLNPAAVLRGSGSVGEAAKVTVDKVPSLCISELEAEQADVEPAEEERRTMSPVASLSRPPLVVRESGVMPAAALPHFRALMAMSSATDRHSLSVDTDQTMSSDSSHSEVDRLSATAADQLTAGKRETVQVNRGPAKARAISLAVDDDISGKLKAKQRKPAKIISSRYMQPTKGPMKGDRSVLPEGYTTKLSSFAGPSTGADASRLKQRHDSGGARSGGSGMKRSVSDTKMKPAPPLNITPDPRVNFGGHSSTPTAAEMSLFVPPAGADISVIGPVPILDVTAAMDKSYRQKSRSLSRTHDSERAVSDAETLLKMIRPNGGDITQWDLELLYGVTVQCAFLESKAKKCLRDQEKQATNQIYALWELVEKSRRRKAELEQQLTKLHHIRLLDDAIELQSSGLNAVAGRLEQVSSEYHKLASALDTTRHHMPTKGIYLPSDRKDEYFDELARALQEQEHLLGELSVMTRRQAPAVDESAKLFSSTENIVEQETSCFSRCQAVLSSVCSMLTLESAVKLQLMFVDDINNRSTAPK